MTGQRGGDALPAIAPAPGEAAMRPVGDDDALVRAARADPGAFAGLYHRYLDRVYAYLRARTATAEDAADLTQQVFLQALAALPRYRAAGGGFAAWLFRIARNVAADWHRRRRATVTWDLVPEALQPDAGLGVDASLLRQEDLARLRALFAALDPQTRELLVLRFAARLTVAEIAGVLGKSEAATQKRLYRIIQTLKEQYHDDTRRTLS
jgi:RNA polymerase sigma-70 factor (ECF subfamily)